MKEKALIILPTYNEADNIEAIIKEIRRQARVDILVVDDGSPDGTATIVKRLKKKNKWLNLIERKGKLGLASAYIEGFKYAIKKGYDYVFEMDADFSHNPSYIPIFLEKVKDADLVIGSRYVKGGGISNWNIIRRLISKVGNIYARMILMVPIKDLTGGFKCFRVSKLKKIRLDKIKSDGYSFQIELNYIFYKAGFKVIEVPIIFEERREGISKMSKKIVYEALKKVWQFKFRGTKGYLK